MPLVNPLNLPASVAFAGASYTLATNNWESIGCALLLTPGRWLILGEVRGVIMCSVGAGSMSARLFNTTTGAEVANSEVLVSVAGSTAIPWQPGTAAMITPVTLTSTSTIDLQCRIPAGATYTARDVYSDADGRTSLVAVYLGPN